jgi:hypothetical protein
MRLNDQLGTIFEDQDFADLFPESGQPAQSQFRLALVTILQSLEGLSDRNAADAVRGRIEETPNIITNAHTDEAVVNDNDALPEIPRQLSQAELLPNKHLADAGYIEAQQLVESQHEYGVELIRLPGLQPRIRERNEIERRRL